MSESVNSFAEFLTFKHEIVVKCSLSSLICPCTASQSRSTQHKLHNISTITTGAKRQTSHGQSEAFDI